MAENGNLMRHGGARLLSDENVYSSRHRSKERLENNEGGFQHPRASFTRKPYSNLDSSSLKPSLKARDGTVPQRKALGDISNRSARPLRDRNENQHQRRDGRNAAKKPNSKKTTPLGIHNRKSTAQGPTPRKHKNEMEIQLRGENSARNRKPLLNDMASHQPHLHSFGQIRERLTESIHSSKSETKESAKMFVPKPLEEVEIPAGPLWSNEYFDDCELCSELSFDMNAVKESLRRIDEKIRRNEEEEERACEDFFSELDNISWSSTIKKFLETDKDSTDGLIDNVDEFLDDLDIDSVANDPIFKVSDDYAKHYAFGPDEDIPL